MKVVVIEDLISTGGSSIECADVLREAGAEVLGVLSIFTYGMAKAARELRCRRASRTRACCDFDTLVEVAAAEGYVQPGDVARLRKRSATTPPTSRGSRARDAPRA